MAIFRKIYPRCWQSMIGLTPTEKTIALYILSGPQTNRCGLYLFSIGKAIEDIETLPQTFAKGFERVLKHLAWEYDKRSRIVYIPTWWKWNPPENPNVLIGNLKDIEELPYSSLISKFYSNTKYLSDNLIKTFTQTLPQTLPQTVAESETETEAEEVTGTEEVHTFVNAEVVDESNGRFNLQSLAALWNEYRPPEIAKVKIPLVRNSKTLKKYHAALKLHPEQDWWMELFKRIHLSAFMKGQNKNGWRATFDWIIDHAEKVYDGHLIDAGVATQAERNYKTAMDWAREREVKRNESI